MEPAPGAFFLFYDSLWFFTKTILVISNFNEKQAILAEITSFSLAIETNSWEEKIEDKLFHIILFHIPSMTTSIE